VVGAWAFGWVVTLHGVSTWGHRVGAWCVLEGLVVLATKWILEHSRRTRWLAMLRMEGELKTLGDVDFILNPFPLPAVIPHCSTSQINAQKTL